jgi:hypothetical protein
MRLAAYQLAALEESGAYRLFRTMICLKLPEVSPLPSGDQIAEAYQHYHV